LNLLLIAIYLAPSLLLLSSLLLIVLICWLLILLLVLFMLLINVLLFLISSYLGFSDLCSVFLLDFLFLGYALLSLGLVYFVILSMVICYNLCIFQLFIIEYYLSIVSLRSSNSSIVLSFSREYYSTLLTSLYYKSILFLLIVYCMLIFFNYICKFKFLLKLFVITTTCTIWVVLPSANLLFLLF